MGKLSQNNRIRIIIATSAILMWVVYSVTTLLGLDVVFNLTSPLVSGLSALLMFLSKGYMGKYWRVGRWFMIGILVWFIGDVVWALGLYVFPDSTVAEWFTDKLYLIPDFCYIGGMIAYSRIRFRKNDFLMAMIDALLIAVVAFIIFQNAIERVNPDYMQDTDFLHSILYFFACLLIPFMVFNIFLKTGFRGRAKSYYVIGTVLILHGLLEIRYTILLFLGEESESAYLDIAYMLFLLIYSLSFSSGDLEEVETGAEFRMGNKKSFIYRHFNKIYWLVAGGVLLSAGIMYLTDFFDERDVFIFFTVAMIYVIMCKTVQANTLGEELLNQQKNENARLEKMVEEKTRELREMNRHLEEISHTDMLTGLYNRRFGIEFLSGLILEAENYPVALYSIDLNYFKPINDQYGHDMGDLVLREVGKRLKAVERCTAVRNGGDEFMVILRQATSRQLVEYVGRQIAESLDQPIPAKLFGEDGKEKEHEFIISASIGVAVFPADTADLNTLFRMADQALYRIKHTHDKSAFLLYSQMQVNVQE